MALAIRLECLVREGSFDSYRDLAAVGQISLSRLSQILRLLDLAPSIQEQLLFLPPTMSGVDPVTERDVRALARVVDWERQQNEFRALMNWRQPS
jgi:hypothetical protein